MNSRVQGKINDIKRMAADSKGKDAIVHSTKKESNDGLSLAIHSQKDADTFTMELKAIKKRTKQ